MPSNAIIDLITALWLGFIGACIGSFLNVVAYRMPLGMSVIWQPSHCPKCNHAIRAYDNVPVFGWLWLRGKCRDCSEPISPRYAIVEFVMGLVFFMLAYAELFSGGANLPGGPLSEFTGAIDNFLVPHWPLIGVYAYHGVLLSLLMSVVLMDRDKQQVPMKFVVFGVVIGFVAPLIWPHLHLPFSLASSLTNTLNAQLGGLFAGAVLGGMFWLRSMLSDQRQWDVHRRNLACMYLLVGAFFGWRAILILCVIGFLIGSSWRFFRQWKGSPPKPLGDVNLFVATLFLIVFWKPLSELFPW